MFIKKSSVENRQSSSRVQNEQLVESWEDGVESSVVECQPESNGVVTETEEFSLLIFATRKRQVKTLQRNSHC
jgi:hypothetical protein